MPRCVPDLYLEIIQFQVMTFCQVEIRIRRGIYLHPELNRAASSAPHAQVSFVKPDARLWNQIGKQVGKPGEMVEMTVGEKYGIHSQTFNAYEI